MLVLRVWVEGDARDLRARIIHERRLGSGERISVAAASIDEVLDIVTHWLTEFLVHER